MCFWQKLIIINQKTGIVNDPLAGQPMMIFAYFEKLEWTDRQAGSLCENSDHHRPFRWLVSWINKLGTYFFHVRQVMKKRTTLCTRQLTQN